MDGILSRLDDYFIRYNKISEGVTYQVFNVEAKELITDKRIDLAVKYYYIKCYQNNEDMNFAKELYEKHIEAFSDGTFMEQGNVLKNSIERYFEAFDKLIDDFSNGRFDKKRTIIPIGKDNELLDGSHRVACAAYFNETIDVVRFPDLSVDYGFEFFRRRLLDEQYMDFIAKELVLIKDDIYIVFLWPRITVNKNIKAVKGIFEENNCKVIYKKRIKFTREGFRELIYQIYKKEHWIGYKRNNFKGIIEKAELCYDKNGYTEINVVQCNNPQLLIKAKEEIRWIFQVGKAALHSTDSKEETVGIMEYIFNNNYKELLHTSFQRNKDLKYGEVRYIYRKVRFIYRTLLNKIKYILGRPV